MNDDKHLTEVDIIIYNFINNKPQEFIDMSITDISKACFTTPTSVTRLTKKLGYNSLKDLKDDLSFYLLRNNKIVEDDIVSSIGKIYLRNFTDVVSKVNSQEIKKVVDLIINAKRIIIYGAGSNYGPAYEFASNLQKINFDAFCSESFQRTITNLISLRDNKQNLIIIISKRFQGSDKEELMKLSEELDINIVVLTGNESCFSKNNKILFIKYPELFSQLKITNTLSVICLNYILELVFDVLLITHKKEFVYYNEKTKKISSKGIPELEKLFFQDER